MTQKNETPALLVTLLITIAVLAGIYWLFKDRFTGITDSNPSPGTSVSPSSQPNSQQSRLSLGDRLLIRADATYQKQSGVNAFANGDYTAAIRQFEDSLRVKPNDPETLIYLNNARVVNRNPIKIAVAVPIGGSLNVASEMLRGVAQAQDEINQKGGVGGRGLQVEIANDDNDRVLAKRVADALVQDNSILAVVGHNSSDATLAAAPEYQQGGLVMISPTSNANNISNLGDYIFRTIPSVSSQADTLSRYTVDVAKNKNVAICFDSLAKSSSSLKEEFTSAIPASGGRIVDISCDFSAAIFDASTAVSDAVSGGADSILLLPSVDRITSAVDIARSNQQRLALLGSSTLYTFKTLQEGQTAVRGMVLPVAWHPDALAGNPFARQARQLWGGDVNWRSALSYDATKAIITGLEQGEISRQALQKALSSRSFVSQGASGDIRFLPNGDRDAANILVKIVPGQNSGTGFDFVPFK